MHAWEQKFSIAGVVLQFYIEDHNRSLKTNFIILMAVHELFIIPAIGWITYTIS